MKTLVATAVVFALAGCEPGRSSVNEHAMESAEQVVTPSREEARDFQRLEEATTAGRDRKECDGWAYDEKGVWEDLAKMKPANQEKWGRVCYQYSCSYRGAIKVGGKEGRLVINAGGWMSFTDEESTQYFVSEVQLPRFLSSCNCCE